jgi:hypothetical protein
VAVGNNKNWDGKNLKHLKEPAQMHLGQMSEEQSQRYQSGVREKIL